MITYRTLHFLKQNKFQYQNQLFQNNNKLRLTTLNEQDWIGLTLINNLQLFKYDLDIIKKLIEFDEEINKQYQGRTGEGGKNK
jgi:hypothetical protein